MALSSANPTLKDQYTQCMAPQSMKAGNASEKKVVVETIVRLVNCSRLGQHPLGQYSALLCSVLLYLNATHILLR